ncbi:transcriptional regulator, HxlR family [Chitinophaga jiangningensis]|uniref:Transcriptional regulator, HxlR family n=1 Tax=Chitinophaga jiangningensis TaxID=1419482 RepID=A0A1M7JST2_9BACT|nr:helix-turn-helix domain-containing protein [Chitinophaga jiangningensis]SHM56076.1 transcriptional regulator, HxlR family [Chitinophaga jiangningensis]
MAKKHDLITCNAGTLRAIRDAMETLNGSWKLQILLSLKAGPKRFRQIAKEIEGISDKMLSKELKDLETNLLVKRTVYDTFPPAVEYEITPYADTLQEVMLALKNWGMMHRKKIVGK